jgi:hypothetical protein
MPARSAANQEAPQASVLPLYPTPAVARVNKKKRDGDYKKRRRPQVSEEALAKRRAAAGKRAEERSNMPITRKKTKKKVQGPAKQLQKNSFPYGFVLISYRRSPLPYNGGKGPQPKMTHFTSGRLKVGVVSSLHEAAKAGKKIGNTRYHI